MATTRTIDPAAVLETHGAVLKAALEVYEERMRGASSEAAATYPGPARAFEEAADSARRAYRAVLDFEEAGYEGYEDDEEVERFHSPPQEYCDQGDGCALPPPPRTYVMPEGALGPGLGGIR